MRRELIITAIAVGLAAAAAYLMLDAFAAAGRPGRGLPWFSPYGFPLLAFVMGFSFAQASAGSRRSTAYRAGRLYDRLAERASEQFEKSLDSGWLATVKLFSEMRHETLRTQTLSARARRGLVQTYEGLRPFLAGDTLSAPEPEMKQTVEEKVARLLLEAVHFRRLRAELEAEAETLEPGRWYSLKLCVASESGESSGVRVRPDFGQLSRLDLLLELIPDNLEVSAQRLSVELPQVGDSTVARASVRLVGTGPGLLKVVVLLRRELAVLQTYEILLPGAGNPPD